jgi:hypothetical protein
MPDECLTHGARADAIQEGNCTDFLAFGVKTSDAEQPFFAIEFVIVAVQCGLLLRCFFLVLIDLEFGE